MAKDFAAVNRMELEAGLATVGNGKDELVSKFVKAWENQTARRALKGGTGISMALTLAACGGGSDAVSVDEDNVINVTPISSDLTANSDNVQGAGGDDTIVAGLVQNPAGSDRVNSLQDEDVVDGGDGTDTFKITLGNTNDNGAQIIAPTILQVENIDVAFTAQESMVLDLQDTDDFLASVDVTRIGTPQADDVYDTAAILLGTSIINMPETAVDLSVADSVFYSDHVFGYRDDEIGDDETVAIELASVNLETLRVGSTNNATNHINTFDLTITEASHVETMNIRGGSAEAAVQTVNIDAQANFILAADFADSEILQILQISQALQDSNGNGDYLDDNQAWAEFEHLTAVNVEGAGDVTLGAVGTAAGFTLDGSTATGDIHVNIANSVDDETASFTTGAGDDRITAISGRVAEAAMASDLVTNAGADSVELDDTALFDTASISTGAGADMVEAEMLHGTVAGGASIDTGSEDDSVSFTWEDAAWDNPPTVNNLGQNGVVEAVIEEEATVSTGSGADMVTFNISDATGEDEAVQVVIEGDSNNSDAQDDLGGDVDLGSENDTIAFSFLGEGLADQFQGTAVIEGTVDGGAGDADVMSFAGNKDIWVVDSNTSDTPTAAEKPADVAGDEAVPGFGVTGIETLNLTSVAGYSAARADAINGNSDEIDGGTGDSLPDIVAANDNDGQAADYIVDLNEFDADLATINVVHLDGVVDNKNAEDSYENAFDGDAVAHILGGIVDEQINVQGFETTAVEDIFNRDNVVNASAAVGAQNNAANDRAVLDPFGNIYDAGTFTADVTLLVGADDAGSTLKLDLQDATPLDISAAGVENYDVKIDSVDSTVTSLNGWASDVPFASLDLHISSNDQLSIDLSNDFDTSLTVTGDAGETGGWANIINVNAAAIDTSGYEGRVYIGYEGTAASHSVIAGNNDDVVRLGDDGQITTVNVTSTVNMGTGNDVLVMNFAGSTVGLGASDRLEGGAGDDVLAFGGTGADLQMYDGYALVASKPTAADRVRHDDTEYDDVYGFETFWYGVGTGNNAAVTHDVVNGLSGAALDDTSKYFDADEYGNPAVYTVGGSVSNGVERFDTDLHQDTNEDVRYIINDENNAAGYDVELDNDILDRNASLDDRFVNDGVNDHYLLNVVNDDHGGVDADFALEITLLDRYHNVNFQGADQHDRVIMSDESLDGRDILIGGGQVSDVPNATDSSLSGDTLEVRNDANITANDLQGVSGFEILELSSDEAVDQQFTVTLDETVDSALDYIFLVGGGEAVYSAGSTFGEIAGAGAARIDLNASAMTRDITVDAEFGGNANDVIVTGSGDDTIIGGNGADTLTGGTGADTFVFVSGDTGIDAAAADTITDFATGSDTLDVVAMDSLVIADGSGLADFAAFVTAAEASFVGGAAADGYVAYDAAGTGNAWVAIDEDGDGAFDAGDTLIILEGINTAAEILATDFS